MYKLLDKIFRQLDKILRQLDKIFRKLDKIFISLDKKVNRQLQKDREIPCGQKKSL